MARLTLRSLRRALTPRMYDEHPVHFHNGPQGRPEVCHQHACNRPRLEVR
jgi:hypothetical protein